MSLNVGIAPGLDECHAFVAQGKNQALKEAGAIVPASFEGLESTVARVYKELVADGTIQPRPEPTPPTVPKDLAVAQKAGLVRT